MAEVYCWLYDGGYGDPDNDSSEWEAYMRLAGFKQLNHCVQSFEMDMIWERECRALWRKIARLSDSTMYKSRQLMRLVVFSSCCERLQAVRYKV